MYYTKKLYWKTTLIASMKAWTLPPISKKIACCRINYDDCLNFEIQVLTQNQIDEYKSKNYKESQDSIKSMETLKRMFEAGFVNHNEYENKRAEIFKRL